MTSERPSGTCSNSSSTPSRILQRDLGRLLHIERATLSNIIATVVRTGLVTQTPEAVDQRQLF